MEKHLNKNKLYKKMSYYYSEHISFINSQSGTKIDEMKVLKYIYESSLLASGLILLINDFEQNKSLGCFIEIRKIIETLSVVKAIQKKHFSQEQIGLAISSGLYMENCQILNFYAPRLFASNLKIKEMEKELMDPIVAYSSEITGRSEDETKKDFLKKQYGFLAFEGKGKEKSSSSIHYLIKKELGKDHADYWKYCNLNIHPSFFSPIERECIRQNLDEAVEIYLRMIENYFDTYGDDIDLTKTKSYQVMKNAPDSEYTFYIIARIKNAFKEYFPLNSQYNSDDYLNYTFQTTKDLLIDALLIKQFVGSEYSISRFKPIFEYSSVAYRISKTGLEDLWNKISDVRVYDYLKDELGDCSIPSMDEIVAKFKSKYPSTKIKDDELKIELKEKTLFFLNGYNLSFMKIVKESVREICFDPLLTDLVYSIYEHTLDDCHFKFGVSKSVDCNRKEYKEAGYKELYMYLVLTLERFVGIETMRKRYPKYFLLFDELANKA